MSAAVIIAKHVKFCMTTNYKHKLNFYITHWLCFNFNYAYVYILEIPVTEFDLTNKLLVTNSEFIKSPS